MSWDDKTEWEGKRKDWYEFIIKHHTLPDVIKQRVYDYRKGLWETPKVFVDGFAYNDGSWLLYNTCRKKGCTLHNKVFCKTKKDVIKQLYSYLCFLKKVGVNNYLEMMYFACCHIIYKLSFKKGIWDTSKKNIDLLNDLVKRVNSKEVTCDRKDTRKYCIDPKLKEELDKGKITGIQRRKDKEMTYKRIEQLYDPDLTRQQNLDKFKENGLVVSESTLKRWKRTKGGRKMVFDENKGGQMVFDENIPENTYTENQ